VWQQEREFEQCETVHPYCEMAYTETQFFHPAYELEQTLEFLCGFVVFFLLIVAFTGPWRIAMYCALVFLVAKTTLHWCSFYKLVVSVDDQHVKAVYGVGFFEREFSLREIASCEPIPNAPLIDRILIPWGFVWPIEKFFSFSERLIALPMRSGQSVRLLMKDGTAVLIATRNPARLRGIIQQQMSVYESAKSAEASAA
jgi:hypothetical protein